MGKNREIQFCHWFERHTRKAAEEGKLLTALRTVQQFGDRIKFDSSVVALKKCFMYTHKECMCVHRICVSVYVQGQ